MHNSAPRFKAVVDWADVQIETWQSTNFQTVQRAFATALGLPPGINIHVDPINPNAGGGTRIFIVRIHDVASCSSIEQTLSFVSAMLPLGGNWSISQIELAIDAYCDDPADQAARFYKFMANPVSANRRMYHEGRGTPKAMPRHFESITRHLSEGWQIAIGNKTDEQYQHIYVKDADTINGERRAVQKRARLEIRLSGAALPCQASDNWKQCKFEKLADHFRQREMKADLDPLIQTLAEATDQIGERKSRNRREGGTRLYSKATKADPINEAIRQTLRNLSKRWSGTAKRGRPTKTGTDSACGISVRINEQDPHEHREQAADSNNYIYSADNNDSYEQQRQHARNSDSSAESAKPIRPDTSHDALDGLVALHEASPQARQELERIDAIIGG